VLLALEAFKEADAKIRPDTIDPAERRVRRDASGTEHPASRSGASHGDVTGVRVARFESGEVDPQHSTEDRYAAPLGLQIERRLAPSEQ
jgi:predicted transcriptional regulator